MNAEEEGQSEASSRIFIQGLPPYTDERRLKELFGERGDVTDIRVLRTKAGNSRQFGFVGFSSAEQAKDCIQYFNNSYIDTFRISVKFAEKAKSKNLARPWSKYSEGSTQYNKRHRDKTDNGEKKILAREAKKQKKAQYRADTKPEDDPELAEFLEVMQPRSKTGRWSNDAAQAAAVAGQKELRQPGKGGNPVETDDEEDELYEEFDVRNKKSSTKGRVGSEGRKPKKGKEPEASESEEEEVVKDAVVLDTDISDLDYLKSRMKADKFKEESDSDEGEEEGGSEEEFLEEEDDEEDSQDGAIGERTSEGNEDVSGGSDRTEVDADDVSQQDTDQERRKSHSEAGPNDSEPAGVPPISETGRLFLRNLPYQATEADLTRLFEQHGDLSEVHLVVDRATGKSKGFALVQFMDASNAETAMAELDGSIFQGRLLHILPAKAAPQPKVSTPDDAEDVDTKDFKKKKAAGRIAEAGNRQAWNSLFMRQDTVAEAIAANFNVTKAELLNKDAADLPVRMALGEAHVVALTKKGLEEGGANIAALEQAALASGKAAAKSASVDRSGTVLLVKNLPYSTSHSELLDMFGQMGPITRLVLPETRTVALVEFQHDNDARRAFQSLAFKRLQTAPLFLEYAPKNIFKPDAPLLANTKDVSGNVDVTVPNDLEGDENTADSSSIFVKNIAWSTTDQSLRKHFDHVVSVAGGTIRAAKIALRKEKDSRGQHLSAGYGFVECSSESVAKIAIKKLQNSMLEGHKLQLQLSMKKGFQTEKPTAEKKEDKKNAKTTKIVVRNVAFEAKSQDVRAVFQPFGQVKSVRVPRKFDGSHRGFAFVDFLTHKEAVSAMESVNGIHLYGRRLVCEWAAQEEGLDDLRAKTAAKFAGQAA